ncbi:MAG: GNAT family N-acyltransferase [Pseudomonadota bacterium]
MLGLRKGRYAARMAENPADIEAAQRLRHLAFIASSGTATRPDGPELDRDAFDDRCRHILIEETCSGQLVCCFRMLPLAAGSEISRSYSAQYYELSALHAFEGPIVEMGRFCVHPERADPDILRVSWGAMAKYVDDTGVKLLFGCSSFQGIEADAYMDAFALLKERHLAPKRWLPKVKAPRVFRFASLLRRQKPDLKRAMSRMPPLLRTYLVMGGWVSDHAVIDDDMNTLHVFTGVEIQSIPPTRARLLRMVAA